MDYVEIAIIGIVAGCLIIGYFSGLVGEIISIISLVLGVAGMAILMIVINHTLDQEFGDAIMAGLFLLVFIVLVQLIKVILKAVKFLAKLPVINGLNKFLGMILGFLEGIIVVWVCFIILNQYNVFGLQDMLHTYLIGEDANLLICLLYKYNLLSMFFA